MLASYHLNLPIKAFYYDNKTSVGRVSERSLTSDGIVVYHSPLGHPEINRYAERVGAPEGAIAGSSNSSSLAAKSDTNLPRGGEPLGSAIGRGSDGEAIPKVNLSNVRLYGSLAYCRIKKQVQSDKINPRAKVGFLVSYLAANV
ncbi:hypothetical protein N7467_002519 [Penicillium canescens]|nr:hypothetical protein N7467_002519 [Penicillium canescens]